MNFICEGCRKGEHCGDTDYTQCFCQHRKKKVENENE